jgi:hypothetical protein
MAIAGRNPFKVEITSKIRLAALGVGSQLCAVLDLLTG